MTRSDVDEVLQLCHLLFEVKYSRKTIIEFLGRNHLAIVLVHVSLCGSRRIIGLSTAKSEWRAVCSTEKDAYLQTFGIDEAFRRRRLGTYLMGVTMAILHRGGVVDVHLHSLPKEANLTFYGKLGFRYVALCPHYYELDGGEQDAVSMTARALDPCPGRSDVTQCADVLGALRRKPPSLWDRWVGRAT